MMKVKLYGKAQTYVFVFKNVISIKTTGIHTNANNSTITLKILEDNKTKTVTRDANKYIILEVED